MKRIPLAAGTLLMVLLCVSCKKMQLTKATEKGANTFSCIVDGKVFKPCSGGLFSGSQLSANVATCSGGEQIAVIFAKCTENMPYKEFYLELRNFHGEGQYSIAGSNHKIQYEERYPDKRYITSAASTGNITITKFDAGNAILAGTFEGTLEKADNVSDKITVKSGRFDIKYK